MDFNDEGNQAIIRGSLGLLPFGLGQAAIEVFQHIYPSRMNKWVDALHEVFGEEIDPDSLNEKFADIVIQATFEALKTSQEEKLESLRNAVFNSISTSIETSEQETFIRLIGNFTVWHIKLLKFAKEPSFGIEKVTCNSIGALLHERFPELLDQRERYEPIWSELYRNCLVNIDSSGLGGMITPSGCVASRITNRGHDFLNFISR